MSEAVWHILLVVPLPYWIVKNDPVLYAGKGESICRAHNYTVQIGSCVAAKQQTMLTAHEESLYKPHAS